MRNKTDFKILLLLSLLQHDGENTQHHNGQNPVLSYRKEALPDEPQSDVIKNSNISTGNITTFTILLGTSDIRRLRFTCTHYQPIHWVFECPRVIILEQHYVTTRKSVMYLENGSILYKSELKFRRNTSYAPTNFSCSDSNNRASSIKFLERKYTTEKTNDDFFFYFQHQIVNSRCQEFTSPEATMSSCPVYINFNMETRTYECSGSNWIATNNPCAFSLDYCLSLLKQDRLNRKCLRQDNGMEFTSRFRNSPIIILECSLEKNRRRIANVFGLIFSIPQQNSTQTRIYTSLQEVRLDPNILVVSPVNSKKEFYTGEELEFECFGFTTIFSRGLRWFTKYSNGSEIDHGSTGSHNESFIAWARSTVREHIVLKIEPNISEIRCEGFISNLLEWANTTYKLENVINSTFPNITNFTVSEVDKRIYTKCTAVGSPDPVVVINLCNITKDENDKPEIISCELVKTNETYFGDYVYIPNTLLNGKTHAVCVANNFLGNITESIELFKSFWKPEDMKGIIELGKIDTSMYFVIGASVIIFVIALIIIIGILGMKLRKRQSKASFLESEMRTFFKGIEPTENINEPIQNIYLTAYSRNYEISRDNIELHQDILGSGQFGIVVKGTYKGKTVAVKTLRAFPDVVYLKALLAEIKILSFVGEHKNIVNLVGANTGNLKKLKVMLVMDYCENGCLLNFLQSCRPFFIDLFDTNKTANKERETGNIHNITTEDLIRFSCEVADAMAFIAEKNIMHGDIAARNVLVTGDISMKLCDFGLAKQLSDYQIYVQEKQIPMPVKWMAIESLKDLKFSIESDAWSYGILLWEIFSLAEAPYPGINWNFDSWKMLLDGYRMGKPQYSNETIHILMQHCWKLGPKERPNFREIHETLEYERASTFATRHDEKYMRLYD